MTEKKSQRRRRAKRITLLVAVLLLVPINLVIYLNSRLPDDRGTLDWRVPNFVLNDTDGVPITRFDLEEHVTVVMSFSNHCQQACGAEAAAAEQVADWVQDRLVYREATEQSPVRMLVMGTVIPPMKLGGELSSARASLRFVSSSDANAAQVFMPTSYDAQVPALSVIDQAGVLRFHRSLKTPNLLVELKPFLSRLVMHHYMEDYLAKRTFFRRTPKGKAGEAPSETQGM